jgi:hypothetical protein
MEAGCPIDYLDALAQRSFRAEPLPGYITSCVYALGPIDTAYVIAVRLATDRPSGTIVTDWSFEPPWEGHLISWDYEPEDVIPKKDRDVYKSLFKSRLAGVLNERRPIRRGCPVDGVLCGRSFQPIGKSLHSFISAKLSFTDDLGNTVPLCIELNVIKHNARRLPGGKGRQRLSLDHLDSVGQFDPGAIPADPSPETGSLPGDLRLGVPDLL